MTRDTARPNPTTASLRLGSTDIVISENSISVPRSSASSLARAFQHRDSPGLEAADLARGERGARSAATEGIFLTPGRYFVHVARAVEASAEYTGLQRRRTFNGG